MSPAKGSSKDLGLAALFMTPQVIAAKKLRSVGGKAYALSQLIEQGLAVPEFIVLRQLPENSEQYKEIFKWWLSLGSPRLAVRSSAQGEDSGDYSFAGQLSSYLNVKDERGIEQAVLDCFASLNRTASVAYQQHFAKSAKSMNVVVQRMVDAKFAGVYFSNDPRGLNSGWVIEVVEGLGESLVSGERTPFLFAREKAPATFPKDWQESHLAKILELGEQAKRFLGYEVDMEWAIDQNNKLWLLQARPITTGDQSENDQYQIRRELARIEQKYPSRTVWDGQTFAEFTGFPSYLTFSIWKSAFAPGGAFGKALREMGYLGFSDENENNSNGLLERIFGRAYINLTSLEDLYFGKIPYVIIPEPRPHLRFSWRKINLTTLFNFPTSLYRMLRVAWRLQTARGEILQMCEKKLASFASDLPAVPRESKDFANWSDQEILDALKNQTDFFSKEALTWPFLLIIMIEATLQSLLAQLAKIHGADAAKKMVQRWMTTGLGTVTAAMNDEFREACQVPSKRFEFLEKYGHRGPGEMDLINPRWIELGDKAFYTIKGERQEQEKVLSIDDEIVQNIKGIKQQMIMQEWSYLKRMLELRETWKMSYMKAYGGIRWLSLELGRRYEVEDKVFWLRLSEVLNLPSLKNKREKIEQRQPRFQAFRKLSFPVVISLEKLQQIIGGKASLAQDHTFEGEALSPGVSHGVVRIVQDISTIDMSLWPDDVILVAEATDPGWTPLFQKVKGVIVERGGVLSHCAIVAREMGLPAVSQVLGCTQRLKDGDHVWVDGTNGRVTLA